MELETTGRPANSEMQVGYLNDGWRNTRENEINMMCRRSKNCCQSQSLDKVMVKERAVQGESVKSRNSRTGTAD